MLVIRKPKNKLELVFFQKHRDLLEKIIPFFYKGKMEEFHRLPHNIHNLKVKQLFEAVNKHMSSTQDLCWQNFVQYCLDYNYNFIQVFGLEDKKIKQKTSIYSEKNKENLMRFIQEHTVINRGRESSLVHRSKEWIKHRLKKRDDLLKLEKEIEYILESAPTTFKSLEEVKVIKDKIVTLTKQQETLNQDLDNKAKYLQYVANQIWAIEENTSKTFVPSSKPLVFTSEEQESPTIRLSSDNTFRISDDLFESAEKIREKVRRKHSKIFFGGIEPSSSH
jgi:uncharacterized protein YoxC